VGFFAIRAEDGRLTVAEQGVHENMDCASIEPLYLFHELERGVGTINRSRWDISFEILKAIKEGRSRPTQIIRAANLNPDTLDIYLDILSMNGLIAVVPNGRGAAEYTVTGKGEKAIEKFRELEELIKFYSVESSATLEPVDKPPKIALLIDAK